jgi:hypothetical protein
MWVLLAFTRQRHHHCKIYPGQHVVDSENVLRHKISDTMCAEISDTKSTVMRFPIQLSPIDSQDLPISHESVLGKIGKGKIDRRMPSSRICILSWIKMTIAFQFQNNCEVRWAIGGELSDFQSQ